MNVFQIFLIVFFGAAFLVFVYSLIEAVRLMVINNRIEKSLRNEKI